MDILHAGIDLGTMHTAVSASNGQRQVLPSEIGWAKDQIAAERLGTAPLFGEDLQQQRLALRTLRPLQKGVLKLHHENVAERSGGERLLERMRAASEIMGHAVGAVQTSPGARVRGVLGVPAAASSSSKLALLEVARNWMESVVLIPEPFAVGYGMGINTPSLIIDIGAGTIDVCHYYGALPNEDDQVTIPFGGDHVDEVFWNRVTAEYPEAQMSLRTARQIKEKFGLVGPTAEPVLIRVPSRGEAPREIDVTEAIRSSCSQLADAVFGGVQDVLAAMPPEYHADALRNIVLAGGGSQLRGLDSWLEEMLHDYGQVHVQRVFDCCYAGANGALKLAIELPESGWAELAEMDRTMATNQMTAGGRPQAVEPGDGAQPTAQQAGAA